MLWPLRQLIKLINYVQCASRQIVIENYQLAIATDKAPEIRFINARAHMTQPRLFIFPFSLFFCMYEFANVQREAKSTILHVNEFIQFN